MKKNKLKQILILILMLIVITLAAVNKILPKVDAAECSACGDCVNYCPVKAIEMVGNKAVIDAEKCINCKICISTCPQNAIK